MAKHGYPNAGDIRRLSSLIRRILIDRDLVKVSSPRNGRVKIRLPDMKPIEVSNRKTPFPFFSLLGAPIFGVYMSAATLDSGPGPREISDFSPGSFVDIKIDNAMKQSVTCLRGEWITRGEIVKYIANIDGGVHSGVPRTNKEQLIRRARQSGSASLTNGVPTFGINIEVVSQLEPPTGIDPNNIDFVLLELLSTAHFLVNSPDVLALENTIRAEISGTAL